MTRIFARCALASVAILGATFAAGVQAEAGGYDQLARAAGVPAEQAATMSLTELAAAKFNRDTRGDDRQVVSTAAPRPVDPARHAHMIAAAGMTRDEAAGVTLTELAAGVFTAGSDDDEAQPVITMSSRGPVRIDPHLAFAAGLAPAEAATMSLGSVAAAKFNRDSRSDDRQAVRY